MKKRGFATNDFAADAQFGSGTADQIAPLDGSGESVC
jgi:hypothetical protein